MNFLSITPKLKIPGRNIIEGIIEWIGSICSMIYFSTPLLQIIQIYNKTISPEALPVTLLLSILFNCTFWLLHGITESINNHKFWASLIICNGFGLLINIVLLFLFLYFFFEKNVKKFVGYGLFVINLIFEVVYLMLFWVIKKQKDHANLVGTIATIVNICMYLSPITNIIKVCKTGKYEFIPILTNIVGFFTTLIWLIYGTLTQDDSNPSAKYTLYSNGFSVLVVAIQISFWLYYFAKSNQNVIKNENDDSLENNNNYNDILNNDNNDN